MRPRTPRSTATRAEWRAWLEQNHTRPNGVWMISYKKSAGKPIVTYEESVEEALCFGWIDSKGNKLDDERTMLWFAPRKPRTGWSRPNKERVARLSAAGLIAEAGQAKIDAAQQDGSWSALDAVEALESPARSRGWPWPPTHLRLPTSRPSRARPSVRSSRGSRRPRRPPPAPSASKRPRGWPQRTSAPTNSVRAPGSRFAQRAPVLGSWFYEKFNARDQPACRAV